MIDPDMRKAVFQLHQGGMSLREISRRLHVSRNAPLFGRFPAVFCVFGCVACVCCVRFLRL